MRIVDSLLNSIKNSINEFKWEFEPSPEIRDDVVNFKFSLLKEADNPIQIEDKIARIFAVSQGQRIVILVNLKEKKAKVYHVIDYLYKKYILKLPL